MKRALVIALLAVLALSVSAQRPLQPLQQKLYDALGIIATHHIDTIDANALADAAINAMVEMLDPHSRYNTTQRDINYLNTEKRIYGIELATRNGSLIVTSVINGSSAHNAGIRVGDIVMSVNGNTNTNDIQRILSERTAEQIAVRILRTSQNTERTYKLKLTNVTMPSVHCALLTADSIAIIGISMFRHTADEEFAHAIKTLAAHGAKALIIDLRNNNGGYIQPMANIASQLIPRNATIATVQYKGAPAQSYIAATTRPTYYHMPIAVLVNGNTASSSELMAAAIQDHDRGVIIGTPTFGKGLTMTPYKLGTASELLISNGRNISPSGRCIQRDYHIPHSQYRSNALRRAARCTADTDTTARFSTLVKHRTVYGNSGILPDIMPKASLTDTIYRTLSAHRIIDLAAIVIHSYSNITPNEATPQYISQVLSTEAKQHGIRLAPQDAMRSARTIAAVKAKLHHLYDSRFDAIQGTLATDPDIQAAISVLNNSAEYNRVLNGD